MARRAQQSSVARCPYCEASLPQVAAECPECRFPLTMAAADFGFRGPDHSGTTSTATTSGRASLASGGHPGVDRARIHGSHGHRMRITAWLLGITSMLLLLAGVGALLTASSPGARSDRVASTNLRTALHRATDDPGHRPELAITTVGADVPSSAPQQVSVDQADGLWFAAAKSTSGRCVVLAGRLADGFGLPPGTFRREEEPCTGAQVRLRTQERLASAGP